MEFKQRAMEVKKKAMPSESNEEVQEITPRPK